MVIRPNISNDKQESKLFTNKKNIISLKNSNLRALLITNKLLLWPILFLNNNK